MQELGFHNTAVAGRAASVEPVSRLVQLRQLRLNGGAKSLKNLTDIELLGRLRALESLSLDRGPDLASLSFLRGLRRLTSLWIEKMVIKDGDLSVLIDLPRLEQAEVYPHRKHYSHSTEQLQAFLGERHRPNI